MVKEAANADLKALEAAQKHAEELAAKADATAEQLRKATEDVVVVFVDMVDSTKFKVEHSKTPERWILRVNQFSEILSDYVTALGGRVVKYLGDEVMASFRGDKMINNAMSLVARVQEIQEILSKATKFDTRIKVAVDFGPVYFLKYEGHEEIDPQGTPVDRCARIGKFAAPGTALSSADFVKKAGSAYNWNKVGSTDLKGLGDTSIYQLGDVTISVAKRVEVEEAEWKKALSRLEDLEIENSALKEKNQNLAHQLKAAGEKPSEADIAASEDNATAWSQVTALMKQVKGLLNVSGVPTGQYARFAFLYFKDGGGEEWNKFEGRTFEEVLDQDLVKENNGRYFLNDENKRNKKLISTMNELEESLREFEAAHGSREDELFAYSLKNAEFWAKKMSISVSR